MITRSPSTESASDKAVTIDLENTSIIDLHDFVDKSKPTLYHLQHHRGPVSVKAMGIIDKWKHSRFMEKMRKKNAKIHRDFTEQKTI